MFNGKYDSGLKAYMQARFRADCTYSSVLSYNIKYPIYKIQFIKFHYSLLERNLTWNQTEQMEGMRNEKQWETATAAG